MTHLLPGNRSIRTILRTVDQVGMFDLKGRFDPQVEHIATVKELDEAIVRGGAQRTILPKTMVRASEYCVYRFNGGALGTEISWEEKFRKMRFVHQVPDVPVTCDGRQISLQRVTAMAVYDSITLLELKQTDKGVFMVFAPDPSALEGRIHIVNFMPKGFALTDARGFPLANLPALESDPNARFGDAYARDVPDGWHGSVLRETQFGEAHRRTVCCYNLWTIPSKVAFVSPNSSD